MFDARLAGSQTDRVGPILERRLTHGVEVFQRDVTGGAGAGRHAVTAARRQRPDLLPHFGAHGCRGAESFVQGVAQVDVAEERQLVPVLRLQLVDVHRLGFDGVKGVQAEGDQVIQHLPQPAGGTHKEGISASTYPSQ